MSFRNWSLLTAAGALIAMACGAPGRDATPQSDTAAPLPSTASPSSAVHDSASGQVASSAGQTTLPSNATASAPARVPAPATAASAAPRRVMIGSVDLTGVGYDVGERTAPVVVIDFSDFGCPYCGEFTRETYPTLEHEYVRTGKVFFKYVPFVVGMFPNGQQAARAAECAADQGKFWPMHDNLYAHQGEWRKEREPSTVFQRDASAIGLDRPRFDACSATQSVHPRTLRANDVANRVGVRVTPSFVVNGRPIEGALPAADFRRVIDAALLLEKASP